ncbi:MFS transporter [Klebsiella quasipneumoniae]|uniref:MFS transporter n=1 Tax=Klebsiella quasipneumoniae TaxID=1463165 RepID=UPI002180EB4F|nr:MFS transporter [Klebsiella quasipneumoniae]GKP09885.1 MFS transporter [Klebsiella quasipneumoniae]
MSQSSLPEKANRSVITDWRPEDPEFWQQRGHHVASRNLWISVPCLLLAFCVWMLFSAVAVNLNKVGFQFTTDQLFMLTALPALSGALLWLGFAVQDTSTPFSVFVIISLLCGFAGANFASSMANISFFFPKAKQGGALGVNGGLGNMGVSVMQLVAPLVVSVSVFAIFGGTGSQQPDGSMLYLENAAWIWVPFLIIFTLAAWFFMNDLSASKASLSEQLPVLKRLHLWIMALLYLATFGSFIGFSAGFAMLSKTQFPDVQILHYAFFGPFIGALARSMGGAISDRLGGTRVTLVNFVVMAVFCALLFLTLPTNGQGGNFIAFFAVFMVLFLTAGLGSASTFQMISVIFRKLTMDRVKAQGGSEAQAMREAATDTAAALGFISAIGAIGGFFIPKAFGISLDLTGSPAGAMKVFLIFYIACVIITWAVYGRKRQ